VSAIFINHPQPPDRISGGFGTGASSEKNQGTHLLTAAFFCDLKRVLCEQGTLTIVTDNFAYAKDLAASIASLSVPAAATAATGTQSTTTTIGGSKSNGIDSERSPLGSGCSLLVSGVDKDNTGSDWDHQLDASYPILSPMIPTTTTTTTTTTTGISSNTGTVSGGAGDDSNSSGGSIDVWRGNPGPEVGHVVSASSYFDRMWERGQKKRRWILFLRKVPCKAIPVVADGDKSGHQQSN